jgi:DNA-binding CsgD family transcriptional regulator
MPLSAWPLDGPRQPLHTRVFTPWRSKMAGTMKARVARLTPRQREVVRLVSLGCTIGEMAAILRLAPSTVDNHRARAMKALGINRVAILTRVAIKHHVSGFRDRLTASERRKAKRSHG